jgi:hypothetical protein
MLLISESVALDDRTIYEKLTEKFSEGNDRGPSVYYAGLCVEGLRKAVMNLK